MVRSVHLFFCSLFACLLAFPGGVLAQTPSQGTYGALAKMGKTDCGGLDAQGRLQKPCAKTEAHFEADALGKCPEGSFFDIGRWSCWSCPKDFHRSAWPVDSARACQRPHPGQQVSFTKATLGGTACPAGSFADPARGGECWSCPAGFVRNITPVRTSTACVQVAREGFAAATKHGPATGPMNMSCPAGQFWGAKDNSCYSCPADFHRTLQPLDSAQACGQQVVLKVSEATLVGVAACKTGEFVDFDLRLTSTPDALKAGGNCWSCPEAANRTVFPVDSDRACQLGAHDFAPATQIAPLTCAPGQAFDLVNAKHPKVQDLVKAKYSPSPVPADLGKGGAGTCWSCKPGFRRTVFPVWDDKACESVGIDWQMPGYVQPGLFGLKGAEQVVRELITSRTLVEDIAGDMAPLLKVSKDQAIRQAWEEIRDTPKESGPLMVAVFSRLLAVADNPSSGTAAERQLLASFAEAAVVYHTFLADQSLQAYIAWNAADKKKNEAYNAVMIAGVTVAAAVTSFGANVALYELGVEALKNKLWPVPDFTDITLRGIIEDQIAGYAQDFVYTKVVLSNTVLKKAFPKAADSVAAKAMRKEFLGSTDKFYSTLGKYIYQKVSKKAAAKAATKVTTKVVLSALESAGPQIMLELAIDTAIAWVQMQIERQNAVPRLEALVADAKRPYEVARLLATTKGQAEVEGMWGTLMGGNTAPADPKGIADAVNAVIAKLPAATTVAATTTPAPAPTPAQAGGPQFEIASAAGTCLRAQGTALSLVACAPGIRWFSVDSAVKPVGTDTCLTAGAAGAAISVAACAAPQQPAQRWTWTQATGLITSGSGQCMEARPSGLVGVACNPQVPGQRWVVR